MQSHGAFLTYCEGQLSIFLYVYTGRFVKQFIAVQSFTRSSVFWLLNYLFTEMIYPTIWSLHSHEPLQLSRHLEELVWRYKYWPWCRNFDVDIIKVIYLNKELTGTIWDRCVGRVRRHAWQGLRGMGGRQSPKGELWEDFGLDKCDGM